MIGKFNYILDGDMGEHCMCRECVSHSRGYRHFIGTFIYDAMLSWRFSPVATKGSSYDTIFSFSKI